MEIKPCPFCGNEEPSIWNYGTYSQVCCGMCDAQGPAKNDVEEAVEKWNEVPRPEPVTTASESAPLTPSNSMGLYTDTITKIAWETSLGANVRQLLEEASELIVACCKYLRATGEGQPTPVTEDQAISMIGEELADVHIVGEVLMQQSETIKLEFDLNEIDKQKRWERRLDGEEQDHTEPRD